VVKRQMNARREFMRSDILRRKSLRYLVVAQARVKSEVDTRARTLLTIEATQERGPGKRIVTVQPIVAWRVCDQASNREAERPGFIRRHLASQDEFRSVIGPNTSDGRSRYIRVPRDGTLRRLRKPDEEPGMPYCRILGHIPIGDTWSSAPCGERRKSGDCRGDERWGGWPVGCRRSRTPGLEGRYLRQERCVVGVSIGAEAQIPACRSDAATIGEPQVCVKGIIADFEALNYAKLVPSCLPISLEREKENESVEDRCFRPEQLHITRVEPYVSVSPQS